MIVSRNSLSPIDFDGLRIFDYTAGCNSSSSLAVVEVEPLARHREAWSNRSDKLYLVIRGGVDFVLDGMPRALDAGDFCLVRRGQHFGYCNRGTDRATLVLVHTPSFDLDEEVFVDGATKPAQ